MLLHVFDLPIEVGSLQVLREYYYSEIIFFSDQHHHSDIKRKKAKVLFDYEPENEDELKIEVGDIVEVIKQVRI